MEELISPAQAAERKQVSEATIYKAIREGRLPAQRVLGRIGLRPSDVDAFEPASYGGQQRAYKRRGPGRPRKGKGGE